MPKALLPTERRRAAVTAKVTGRTLRIRGNLDLDAAVQYFGLPESIRTDVKWIDLSDVGGVYARGFLPIVADFVAAAETVKLRVVDNSSVERYLDVYGYRTLLTGLGFDSRFRQRIKVFRKDGPEVFGYVTAAVDEFLDRALRADRIGAQTLEWALGELIGNVFHHAESPIGLLAQCLVQPNHQVIFTLVDRGIGIRKSLSAAYPITSDRHALELAVQQGSTSKRGNQGWGLFGSVAIVEAVHGSFMLWSGSAALFVHPDGHHEYRDMPHFAGTAIDWRIPTYTRLDLQHVLKIKNEPITLLWNKYDEEAGIMRFRLADQAASFIDRPTGKRLRTKLLNLTRDALMKCCIIDFAGVRMVTSSFADEFLGQSAVLLGEATYKNYIRLDNVDDVILGIINGAVQARLRTERHAKGPMRITSE